MRPPEVGAGSLVYWSFLAFAELELGLLEVARREPPAEPDDRDGVARRAVLEALGREDGAGLDRLTLGLRLGGADRVELEPDREVRLLGGFAWVGRDRGAGRAVRGWTDLGALAARGWRLEEDGRVELEPGWELRLLGGLAWEGREDLGAGRAVRGWTDLGARLSEGRWTVLAVGRSVVRPEEGRRG